MAKVLTSISLDSPAAPVTASTSDTFAFTGTPTLSGGGGVQRYDFRWEVNPGSGFVTIGAATGLTTADTNPLVNTNSQTANSITVTCTNAGTYTVRMAGAPSTGGSYTVLSATQSVTVSAPASVSGSGGVSFGFSTAGSGTYAAPAYEGSGGVAFDIATAGTGTVLGPAITGTGAVAFGFSTSGTGEYTPQPVTGTGGVTFGFSSSGFGGQAASYSGSGGVAFGFGVEGSGTSEAPTSIQGSGGVVFSATTAGQGGYIPAPITGSGGVTFGFATSGVQDSDPFLGYPVGRIVKRVGGDRVKIHKIHRVYEPPNRKGSKRRR